ncbi:MAG: NAD-dependent epimerase/dehydratase family protein [Pseudomonadota bacterium]|nr:NAD-dependent epimerase/dehydratase family protein [Pseudomonadota bacterium]
MRPVVVTGVSGFIGRHVAKALLERGVAVRGLVRRRSGIDGALPAGVEVVEGDLANPAVADDLTRGAAAVIHCAGAIRARSRQEFFATNGNGTQRIVEAAEQSGVERFVQVSSLAAREPDLSDYAASKREGENAVARAARRISWITVRPPAVYGPGDRATLPLVRALSRRTAWLPGTPAQRLSLIHVTDLALALAMLASSREPNAACFEIDDGRPGGYGWPDFEAAASRVNGRPTRIGLIPKSLLIGPALAASVSSLFVRRAPLLSLGKLNELYHPDWVARGPRLEAVSAWRPTRGLETGLRETMAWYRERGWLPAGGAGSGDAFSRVGLTAS